MSKSKKWSKEEEDYLIESWGTVSCKQIAKKLNRSENAVIVKKNRLELGRFLENGDYITWNQLNLALGISKPSNCQMVSWVQNRNFPIRKKKIRENNFRVIKLEDWWTWAWNNQDLLDFSKLEENLLGKEPNWVKEKRKYDFERNQKYKKTQWTTLEDDRLIYLVKTQKYTYLELVQLLQRNVNAIIMRLNDLQIKDRPVKADNHIPWIRTEVDILNALIKQGCSYELIAEKVGKSEKACRGKIYRMYGTESLDKVRQMIFN